MQTSNVRFIDDHNISCDTIFTSFLYDTRSRVWDFMQTNINNVMRKNKNMGQNNLIQQKLMEDSIKQEIEQTLSLRAKRYLKVKPHGITPHTQFAPASLECALLFRDGYYYGCITLVQSVAETIARFLCQKNSWKPEKKFENNIERLLNRHFISEKLKNKFLKIWENRDDYHHLDINIEVQKTKLEEISYEKVLLLKEIESEIFKFSLSKDGKLIPENKKYWELSENGTKPVFLKLG